MPERVSFEYAVIRIVPRVEREEFLNAGVLLFCLAQNFLDVRVGLDETRLLALYPEADLDSIRSRLEGIVRVCHGVPDAGPIAQLSVRERFHWLVSPRSTMVQVSPVHSGLCDSPETTLDDLFQRFVAPARSGTETASGASS